MKRGPGVATLYSKYADIIALRHMGPGSSVGMCTNCGPILLLCLKKRTNTWVELLVSVMSCNWTTLPASAIDRGRSSPIRKYPLKAMTIMAFTSLLVYGVDTANPTSL